MFESKMIYIFITTGIAILVMMAKSFYLGKLRKTHQINIRTGIFRLYSQENIYTTHSEKKRDFMQFSNIATAIVFVCTIATAILLLLIIAGWVSGLMGNL
jgi:hypothetical protein